MTSSKNEVLLNALSKDNEASKVSAKEIYEKPALTVVNFMFESDITWGSFDDNSSHHGDNTVSVGDSWWD